MACREVEVKLQVLTSALDGGVHPEEMLGEPQSNDKQKNCYHCWGSKPGHLTRSQSHY